MTACVVCQRKMREAEVFSRETVQYLVTSMQTDFDPVEVGDPTGELWTAFGSLQSGLWFLQALLDGRCVLCESDRQQKTGP